MIQITLTPEQEQFLERQLKTGKYNTPQEVIEKVRLAEEFKRLCQETQALHADNPLTDEEIAAEIEAYRRGE